MFPISSHVAKLNMYEEAAPGTAVIFMGIVIYSRLFYISD